MARFTLKSTFIGVALVSALAGPLTPGATEAARAPHSSAAATPSVANPDEGKDCHSLSIHLNGDQPVVLYCPEKHGKAGPSALSDAYLRSRLPTGLGFQIQPASLPGVSPRIGWDSSCSHDYVHIWSDSNHTGDSVYFCGAGSVNMDQVLRGWGGIYGNWDRIASSYEINNAYCTGRFWDGQFETGQRQNFGPGNTGNFDGQGGRLSNDSVRSLTMDSNCPGS